MNYEFFARKKCLLIEINFKPTLVQIFSSPIEDIVMSVSMYLIRITCLSVEEMQSIPEASGFILKFLPDIVYARVDRGSINMRQACYFVIVIFIFLFLHFNSLALKKYQLVYS